MARRSLKIAAIFALAAGVVYSVTACAKRDVYLVSGHSTAGVGGSGGSTSVSPMDGGHVRPPSHLDSGKPSSTGGRSAVADSGEPDASEACVTTRTSQIPQPLGVYIIIDQSYSMLANWTEVSQGLQQFIAGSDELGGVSIGIQYYAISPSSSTQPYGDIVCQLKTYQTPDVQMKALPENQDALFNSIANHGPASLNTLLNTLSLALQFKYESPIDAAIGGAIQGARDWMMATSQDHAGEHPAAVVLLVTNGVASTTASPTCMPSTEKAGLAAEAGVMNGPSVPTYVLAVGGQNADLDHIALMGGTLAAYPVIKGGAGMSSADVLVNLIHIRQAFLPCDISISSTDPDLANGTLNVELDQPGMPRQRYGRVASVMDCSNTANPGEWYVDTTATETKVRLCRTTCESARARPDATLDIVHGCKTTVIQ